MTQNTTSVFSNNIGGFLHITVQVLNGLDESFLVQSVLFRSVVCPWSWVCPGKVQESKRCVGWSWLVFLKTQFPITALCLDYLTVTTAEQ